MIQLWLSRFCDFISRNSQLTGMAPEIGTFSGYLPGEPDTHEVGKFAIVARRLRRRQAAVQLLETELADRVKALEFATAFSASVIPIKR
jgi:hypothetical protein